MHRIWILVGVLALVAAACSDISVDAVAAPSQAGSDSAPDDNVGEGIQVHGDWTITVVNPDGSVASATEFSNDLANSGQLLLVRLLTGQIAVSSWFVSLLSVGGICSPLACFITEPAYSPSVISTNLQVTNQGQSLGLAGSFTATGDGQVTAVGTYAVHGALPAPFTSTNVAPVDVLAGQEVFVTVTISFS